MRIGKRSYQAVNWHSESGGVQWIEQRLLPHRFEQIVSPFPEEVAVAIETMQVRGAPTIGATAAYGLALAWKADRSRYFDYWVPRFRSTRPTAVNLFHACDAMQQCAETDPSNDEMIERAEAYAEAEVAANRAIGAGLAEYLAVGERRILTHCNAGWLAAVDWGTATSGIYHLAHAGEKPFVWVDETRPRLQGARLTAWELHQEGIDCRIQADSAAAWMMAQGKVDAIVVGADRIAANGDVANKIGTYALSLAAKAHGVPMYVAAPKSTFDLGCASGKGIPIEERDGGEVVEMDGVDCKGEVQQIRVAATGVGANNPAFDVTPFENITAIVCESGVWRP
ncbi:methylthioribose-1-phosphate isomerase [Mariprofundus ferrinatatus]|uniref:Methylthioribose-1-phosphate isomerase n=1 Tax=Mariprofundus ferrinatatus TaxID=1921087 RepID=A0A2K8L759_9PROT|nr:S-methyl-5-thioribose-1-phosphate isomerase [Mariprofundus ferrinatatus]ATX83107.1 methylthioribose-1-phosphate isomerase [Mariprofundus ferrinatatus]